jgi:hypothetical protein
MELVDQAGEQEEQGCFAGAIGADQADSFAVCDMEADVVQGGIALGVGVVEVFGFDEAAHGR